MLLIEETSTDALGVALDRSCFSTAAFKRLHAHTWPGNEVELRSLLGTLAGRLSGKRIHDEDIANLLKNENESAPHTLTEKDRVVEALWRNGFNRSRTAETLGMSRKTLYNKMQKYGLSG